MKPIGNIKIDRHNGFIITFLFYLCYVLERISIFFWIRTIHRAIWFKVNAGKIAEAEKSGDWSKLNTPFTGSYLFPELWSVGNLAFAWIVQNLLGENKVSNKVLIWIFIIYSIMRVFELFIYQINVLFFHQLNGKFMKATEKEIARGKVLNAIKASRSQDIPDGYVIKSATRTVILLIFNMAEYILQFAIVYAGLSIIQGITPDVSVMGSFGLFMNSSSINEVFKNNVGSMKMIIKISQMEVFIGVFMNIVCLARFVGMLPEVRQLDKR